MNLQLRGIALYWQMHTPCRAARAKNQYPLKSMIPALSRENILADNFIAELPWKICRHQKGAIGK